jgi:hypothetical protein
MNKNAQRVSHLISTFGPGAMMDLPTRSVVVGGLEQWEMVGDAFKTIPEPRLTMRLEYILKSLDRLDRGATLSLRTPPVDTDNWNKIPRGVAAPVFPAWFVCELGETDRVTSVRRRRLVPWRDLDSSGRRKYVLEDGRKSDVTPIRFVCACKDGHLQDIDWRWAVHGSTGGTPECFEPMWVEEKGTSADPADTSIVCGCGSRLSLQDTFQPGRLGKCLGNRPWLLDRDPAGCGDSLRLLIRTATNTYFPQVYTVISLPAEEDELTRLVDDLSGELVRVKSVEDVGQAKLFNSKIAASLGIFADGDIFERLQRIRQGAALDFRRSPKHSEFDVFASGRAEIGQNDPDAKLFAQTLPRNVWVADTGLDLGGIKGLVAVHRLREVSCLYGFTRFEAAPTSADGELEDIALAVKGAPLSRGADWLPAIEQFGEGVFIHFDEAAIGEWLRTSATKRHGNLVAGYRQWRSRFTGEPPPYPGTAYVLLHSLSHALMAEIALDCGYPASSLKERVYALSSTADSEVPDRCGILIYTATAGAQGTLGGLVATAPRFALILRSALERLRICSSDPICADHVPDAKGGDRATHGAACHGCLLIAETSCEMRNLFLDRSLLVRTMGKDECNFFQLPDVEGVTGP